MSTDSFFSAETGLAAGSLVSFSGALALAESLGDLKASGFFPVTPTCLSGVAFPDDSNEVPGFPGTVLLPGLLLPILGIEELLAGAFAEGLRPSLDARGGDFAVVFTVPAVGAAFPPADTPLTGALVLVVEGALGELVVAPLEVRDTPEAALEIGFLAPTAVVSAPVRGDEAAAEPVLGAIPVLEAVLVLRPVPVLVVVGAIPVLVEMGAIPVLVVVGAAEVGAEVFVLDDVAVVFSAGFSVA